MSMWPGTGRLLVLAQSYGDRSQVRSSRTEEKNQTLGSMVWVHELKAT